MKKERFKAAVLPGHKENAVAVPFDPAVSLGIALEQISAGRMGYPVSVTIDGAKYESFVVARAKKHWLLVDAHAAEVAQTVTVTITARPKKKRAPNDESEAPLASEAEAAVALARANAVLEKAKNAARAFAQLASALRSKPGVTVEKASDTAAGALRVNGRFFAMLARGTLIVRLSRKRAAEVSAAGQGVPFAVQSATMKNEWVALGPPSPLWKSLARESLSLWSLHEAELRAAKEEQEEARKAKVKEKAAAKVLAKKAAIAKRKEAKKRAIEKRKARRALAMEKKKAAIAKKKERLARKKAALATKKAKKAAAIAKKRAAKQARLEKKRARR